MRPGSSTRSRRDWLGRATAFLVVLAIVAIAAETSAGHLVRRHGAPLAEWSTQIHVKSIVDLTMPDRNGTLFVTDGERLARFRLPSSLRLFATGPRGYKSPGGGEPYIALSSGQTVSGARCRFPREAVYALRLVGRRPGVTQVDASGHATLFARLPAKGLENGIAFDQVGGFGHRLLVANTVGTTETVYAIDCRGRVKTITSTAPRVEGGMTVVPRSFKPFGGDLIAPDEVSGNIDAIAPNGTARLVANSELPAGEDTGVESVGYVPPGFSASWSALVTDRRYTPDRENPGDNAILRATGAALLAAGVKPGELLVVTESGAETDAVSCGPSTCTVQHVADGPTIAHPEGHVEFVP